MFRRASVKTVVQPQASSRIAAASFLAATQQRRSVSNAPASSSKPPTLHCTAEMHAQSNYNDYCRKLAYMFRIQEEEEAAAAAALKKEKDLAAATDTTASSSSQNEADAAEASTEKEQQKEETAKTTSSQSSSDSKESTTTTATTSSPFTPNPKRSSAWKSEQIPEHLAMDKFLQDSTNLFWTVSDIMTHHVQTSAKNFDLDAALKTIGKRDEADAKKNKKDGGNNKASRGKSSSELKLTEAEKVAEKAAVLQNQRIFHPKYLKLLKLGYNNKIHTNPHHVACATDAPVAIHLVQFDEMPLATFREITDGVAPVKEEDMKKMASSPETLAKMQDPLEPRAVVATVDLKVVCPPQRNCGTIFDTFVKRTALTPDRNITNNLSALLTGAGGFTHGLISFMEKVQYLFTGKSHMQFYMPQNGDAGFWEKMPDPFPQVAQGGLAARRKIRFLRIVAPSSMVKPGSGDQEGDEGNKKSSTEKSEKTSNVVYEDETRWRLYASSNEGVIIGEPRARV